VNDVDITRLRWLLDGHDVTCENCHTARYRANVAEDGGLCPACRYALGEDLLMIQTSIATQVARLRG